MCLFLTNKHSYFTVSGQHARAHGSHRQPGNSNLGVRAPAKMLTKGSIPVPYLLTTDVYTRLDCDQRVWGRDCHSDTNLAISKRMMLHITEPSLDHQMFGRPCDISVMGPRMKCSRED